MENTKAKNVIIIVLIIILVVFVGCTIYFMYNLNAVNNNENTTSQLLTEIATKNVEITNKQKEIEEITKKYDELKKEVESIKESTKTQTTTTTTTSTTKTSLENELKGTIFSDITKDTFVSMKVILNDTNTGDSNFATITNYTTALNVLKKLTTLTYKKTTATGIGIEDYEVDVTYKKSGKTYTLRVTPTTVFASHFSYVYKISGTTALKNEVKKYITNVFNQNQ